MDLKSNEPFWLVKNGLVSSYPSLKKSIACDVLIVGGGITGSLLAHQMIKDGYSTVLIDRREVVHGSSSATTSLLQYEIDVPLCELIDKVGKKGAVASYKACAQAIDTLEKITKEINSNAGFTKKNSLYYAALKKQEAGLKREFESRKEAGFNVRWLEKEEIQKRYGFEKAYGGILSSQGASVDAYRLAHELLRYNSSRGLKVFDRTELKEVKDCKNHVIAKCGDGIEINANRILYCTGYETQSFIEEKFVDLKSTYAMVSEVNVQPIKPLSTTLFWNTADPYLYFRTTDDGRLLVGGADEEFQDAMKRDAQLNSKEMALKREFQKLWPTYEFYTDFVWAGTFGETKDGLPYIGTHPRFPHSYFVLGFGGNGITFSVIGMEMASLFLKKRTHPLTPYFKFGRDATEQER